MERVEDTNHKMPFSLRQFLTSNGWKTMLGLSLVIFLICFPIYYFRIVSPVDSDYGSHLLFARYLIRGDLASIPAHILAHPGLQVIVAISYWITFRKVPIAVLLAGILVGFQIITAIVLYIWFGNSDAKKWNVIRAFAAASLTIVAPLMLLAILDNMYYFGYIGLVSYHNPTVQILRPIALLSFIVAVRVFEMPRSSWHWIVFSALLVILSALIKPNYLICILPAMAVMAGWQWLHKQPVDWLLMVAGFFIPAGIVLAGQWGVAYSQGDNGSIIFSFLGVESAFSSYLLPKFLLSIVFPVVLLGLYPKSLSQDKSLLLAWIGFVIGAIQVYFLAESGDRFYHGNFRWSGQIMLFLLFATSIRYLLTQLRNQKLQWERKSIIVAGAYLLYVAAGMAYYIRCFLNSSYG